MNPAKETRIKIVGNWNAGRTEWGKKGFDNFLIGASWQHWGAFNTERQTVLYLGLWTVTVTTPSGPGKTRKDIMR